jgi:hypothetical protein
MDVQMSEPSYFKPYALMKAPVITETRLIRDHSMPLRDWSAFDAPSYERTGRKAKHMVGHTAPKNVCWLVRQAQ